jgi:hypothetical protein
MRNHVGPIRDKQDAPKPKPRYLRTPGAAIHIGAAAQTLERWRIEGIGPPFVRLSPKLVVYDLADLDAWCAARKVSSTSEPAPAMTPAGLSIPARGENPDARSAAWSRVPASPRSGHARSSRAT